MHPCVYILGDDTTVRVKLYNTRTALRMTQGANGPLYKSLLPRNIWRN